MSMCRSAANIIKVEGTIITFEGGDRADFGQVAEGCVRRAEPDVKDAVGIKQRARVVEPAVSISLRNDISDRADAAEVVEGVGNRAEVGRGVCINEAGKTGPTLRGRKAKLLEGVVGMVSGEEGGIGEGDVGGSGTNGLIDLGGSGHPGRRRNSTEEMVALGVDAVEKEEVAILGAAVEGGEDGGGIGDVGLTRGIYH